MGTHPIFESDFDCLTERELDTPRRCAVLSFGLVANRSLSVMPPPSPTPPAFRPSTSPPTVWPPRFQSLCQPALATRVPTTLELPPSPEIVLEPPTSATLLSCRIR